MRTQQPQRCDAVGRCDAKRRRLAGPLTVLAALAVMSVAFAGCSGETAEPEAAVTTPFVARPIINLAVNDWTASAVNVAIAEQLIERHLAHPVVPQRIDSSADMYDALADGSIDAVLEIWPSSISDRDRRFYDRGDVDELGPLGPDAGVGWFVPRYVLDEYPELADWSGFASPDAAALFATAETAPQGRLLGIDPAYAQYDEQIVSGLGLPLQVVFSGSEAASTAEAAAAVADGRPILLYWWTPTAAVADLDLVEVTLPPADDSCAADAAQGQAVTCGYPEDELMKVASPLLEARAPEVHRFLTEFTLSTEDQLGLLVAIERDGVSIEAAAAAWVDANEATWRPWVDGG